MIRIRWRVISFEGERKRRREGDGQLEIEPRSSGLDDCYGSFVSQISILLSILRVLKYDPTSL